MKMNNCIQLAAATKPPNPIHTFPADMLTVKLNECVCKDVADVLETGSVGARDVDVGGNSPCWHYHIIRLVIMPRMLRRMQLKTCVCVSVCLCVSQVGRPMISISSATCTMPSGCVCCSSSKPHGIVSSFCVKKKSMTYDALAHMHQYMYLSR
jgi:hypothetical protein